ncbi:MAG: hypothetical protein LBT37_05915 [Lactobacillaceae bacterium]|jgi:hypothetical protein|nr:hypothetical protein [Lactobacillaceae bacterium]
MNKKIKNVTLSAMALGAVGPLLGNAVIYAEDSATITNDTASSSSTSTTNSTAADTDPVATLKSMVTVNGNPLTKDKAIMAGDDVTWDVIATPGNTGLMTYFQDKLPNGVKLSPNSTLAIQAFNINNDGTQGDEITSEGTTKINGQTITWTPKDPVKYFYVGSTGTQNRILFHISTVAQQNIDPDYILENLGTLRVTNPKDPDNPVDVTSKARVHTVRDLAPTLQKAVSDDDGATWTDFAQLPSKDSLYEYKLTADIPVGMMKSSFSIDDPMVNVQSFDKDSVKIYRVLPKTAKTDDTSSDASSSAAASDTSSAADSTSTSGASSAATSDTSSVAMSDATSSAATTDASTPATLTGVAKTNDKEQDVTKYFTITTGDDGDLHAEMNYSYLKSVRDSTTPLEYEVVVNGVTFKQASADDLKKYLEGGLPYIPNTASADVDKTTVKSNQTRVTAPEPADPKAGAISKAVSVDQGKTWIENGQLTDKSQAYDYKIDVVAPVGANVKTLGVKDTFLAGQTVDPTQLKMYMKTDTTPDGQLGDEITDQGTFTVTKDKDGNSVVAWAGSQAFSDKINAATDSGVKFTLVANNVSLANSTDDQLKAFIKDNTTTVPNTATLVQDGKDTLKSNTVTISLPPLADPKPAKQVAQDVLANTGEAIRQNPIMAALGALAVLGGAGTGIYKYKSRKKNMGE